MADPHIPVLLAPLLRATAPIGGVWLDGTFGAGGYARGLLDAGADLVIGVDRDPSVFRMAEAWRGQYGDRLRLVEGTFSDMDVLAGQPLDGVVLDGVDPGRTPVRVRVSLFVTDPMPVPGQRVMLTAHLGPPPGPADQDPQADARRGLRRWGGRRPGRRLLLLAAAHLGFVGGRGLPKPPHPTYKRRGRARAAAPLQAVC